MLDFSETLVLIKQAQNNDELAKEKLINENSPLIKSVIRRYKNKGVEYEDLYQLGSLGFYKAVQNFKEEFNVKFSTYAVPMISGEVKRYLRDNGIIKVSRSVKTLSIQINKYSEEYLTKNGKNPTIDNIANNFGITTHDVVFAMESGYMPLSLNAFVGTDESSDKNICVADKILTENDIDNRMNKFFIMTLLNQLSLRDKKIIMLRYFRGKTQKEVAIEMGVSQVQISRLESKILEKLKLKLAE